MSVYLRRDGVEAVGRLHRGVGLVVERRLDVGERVEEDVALVAANLNRTVVVHDIYIYTCIYIYIYIKVYLSKCLSIAFVSAWKKTLPL